VVLTGTLGERICFFLIGLAGKWLLGLYFATVRIVNDAASLRLLNRESYPIGIYCFWHAHTLSDRAKLVKLADKICNVYDMVAAPPASWTLHRKREYLQWAKDVVDRLRGTHPALEATFDDVHAKGVRALGDPG
jgi:hypothetical protein